MLVGRCSWELSGRKLHRKIKKVANSERSASQKHGAIACLQLRPEIPPQLETKDEREEGAKVGGSYNSGEFTHARPQTLSLTDAHRTGSKKGHGSPVSPQNRRMPQNQVCYDKKGRSEGGTSPSK
jgi:hypothetical protein